YVNPRYSPLLLLEAYLENVRGPWAVIGGYLNGIDLLLLKLLLTPEWMHVIDIDGLQLSDLKDLYVRNDLHMLRAYFSRRKVLPSGGEDGSPWWELFTAEFRCDNLECTELLLGTVDGQTEPRDNICDFIGGKICAAEYLG